jgi:putative transposase
MHYLTGRYRVSARRACRVIRTTRSSVYYVSRKDPLTGLRQRMRELAQTRVRFGYRRLLVLLRREGWTVGKARFYRVYTEEGLALRRKRPWRHATAVHREHRRPATARNDIWSMDFVADEMTDGRRFRALTVIDLFTHECLAIDAGRGLTGQDVAATLERLRFERGLPQRIYCDTGLPQKSRRQSFSNLTRVSARTHTANRQAVPPSRNHTLTIVTEGQTDERLP